MWSPFGVTLQRTRFPSRRDVMTPVAVIRGSALRAALGSMSNSARPLSSVEDQAGCPAGQTNSPIITSSTPGRCSAACCPGGCEPETGRRYAPMISGGSGEQVADARDDLLAVQLDVGHQLV